MENKTVPKKPPRNGNKTGPKPDTVKIEGDWEDAIDKALQKERPKDGWPKAEKKRDNT